MSLNNTFHMSSHEKSARFCSLLDGGKSGLTIEQTKLDEHIQKFKSHGVPRWTVDRSDASWRYKYPTLTEAKDRAERALPPFIMDEMDRFASAARNKSTTKIEGMFKEFSSRPDEHLLAPYKDALKRSEARREQERAIVEESYAIALRTIMPKSSDSATITTILADLMSRVHVPVHGTDPPPDARLLLEPLSQTLHALERHVEDVQEKHGVKVHQRNFTNKNIVSRQDVLRELSRKFYSGPVTDGNIAFSQEELRRIAASYAYFRDREVRKGFTKPWSRFPFDVAFRDLCDIKATALGRKPVVDSFYEQMVVKVRR